MTRTCTTCGHPQRETIERALLSGQSIRSISAQFGLTHKALRWHKESHLSTQLAQVAQENKEADARTAINVIEQLRTINAATLEVMEDAKATGDADLLLKAVDRIHRQIETQAKLIDLIADGERALYLEGMFVPSALQQNLSLYTDEELKLLDDVERSMIDRLETGTLPEEPV